MPNKAWLVLAWIWTVIVTVLCLVRMTDLPKVAIESPDKYVHAIFHFTFVLLWGQHFRKNTQMRGPRVLLTSLAYSIVFGCLIEIAQEFLTTTRHADLKDVLANFCGAALAVLLHWALAKLVKRKPQ